MKYFWSLFFVVWPIVAVVACVISPAYDLWLPPRHLGVEGSSEISVNPLGREIDGLFYLILWITAAVFILTQIVLAWVLISGSKRDTENRKAAFLHGDMRLEVLWTVIPGAILMFLAFDQLDVWANFRVVETFPAEAREQPLAEIEAYQFGWQVRYPEAGKVLSRTAEPTDFYDNDRLYVPVGKPVLIWLRTRDVQHSFFVPQFRIKQDALPGQAIPVWFQADEPGEFEFLCAELCGWGHYKMGGMIIAQEPEAHAASMEEVARMNRNDGVDQP